MEQKKNQNKSVLTYAILGILLLVFGYYSTTMNYAHAVSVVNVTGFIAGTVTRGVAYRDGGLGSSDTDTTAFIIGNNGAQAFAWKKSGTTNTIIANVSLTGSTVGNVIEFNKDIIAVYVATENKMFKLTTNLGIAGQLATGTAGAIRKMIYDDTHNLLYFCTGDTYGIVNQVTLALTTLYTDFGANTIFDCDIDEINNIMYLAGSGIGASATCEALKISLNTHTEQDCASFAGVDASLFGVCYDSGDNKIWYSSSAGSKVKKLDSNLDLVVDVALGTVPRSCSISTDTGARRLYQVMEGADSVSIIDIDSNSVLSTQVVCDVGSSQLHHIDTKRLFNTTNTYIPCPVSTTTNRVIIDDTVSEDIPDVDQDSCDNPANANLLRCRLADGEDITGIGEVVGTGVTDLACNVIFVDCSEDTDPSTNGIGLLIFIASIFVVIGMFYYSIGKEAFHIPLFIYVVIILALSAFFTITGLIDPVFLILSIVAIVALASPKLISTIRGSTFGGGSTA